MEEGGSLEISKNPFAKFAIIAKAQNDLQEQVWKDAANHEHGKGLESGIPSLQSARETVKYLRKHGFYAGAKALEFVVGAFRDPEEEAPEQIRICARCAKGKKATRFHIAYECSDNKDIVGRDFQKNRHNL